MWILVVAAIAAYVIYQNGQTKGRKRYNYHDAYKRQRMDFSAYQSPSVTQNQQQSRVQYTQNTQSVGKTAAGSAHSKKPKEKAPVVLLVAAICFFVVGFIYFADMLGGLFNAAVGDTLNLLINSLAFLGGGAASLFARGRLIRRTARLAKYLAVMGDDDCKSVAEISKATGLPKDRVRKDLELLASRGDFGVNAYFDNGLDSIVISEAAAEKERQIRQNDRNARKTQAERDENTTEYMRIYEEMREAASNIRDTEISGKMMQLTELTGKILSAAEKNPEKEKDIRRFMSYYLPQTQKLMVSYSTLEKQGVATSNISSTKDRISGILDNLITGYEQQLDKMFDSDALDISSDIDVLETMLKQDGLNSDGSGIAMGGH